MCRQSAYTDPKPALDAARKLIQRGSWQGSDDELAVLCRHYLRLHGEVQRYPGLKVVVDWMTAA